MHYLPQTEPSLSVFIHMYIDSRYLALLHVGITGIVLRGSVHANTLSASYRRFPTWKITNILRDQHEKAHLQNIEHQDHYKCWYVLACRFYVPFPITITYLSTGLFGTIMG